MPTNYASFSLYLLPAIPPFPLPIEIPPCDVQEINFLNVDNNYCGHIKVLLFTVKIESLKNHNSLITIKNYYTAT